MPNTVPRTVLQNQRRAARIGFYLRLTILITVGAGIAWLMWYSPMAVKKHQNRIEITR